MAEKKLPPAETIMDVLVCNRATDISDAVNGRHPDEPNGIPREDIHTIEHDATHGRWVIFYYRKETQAEIEARVKKDEAD